MILGVYRAPQDNRPVADWAAVLNKVHIHSFFMRRASCEEVNKKVKGTAKRIHLFR